MYTNRYSSMIFLKHYQSHASSHTANCKIQLKNRRCPNMSKRRSCPGQPGSSVKKLLIHSFIPGRPVPEETIYQSHASSYAANYNIQLKSIRCPNMSKRCYSPGIIQIYEARKEIHHHHPVLIIVIVIGLTGISI